MDPSSSTPPARSTQADPSAVSMDWVDACMQLDHEGATAKAILLLKAHEGQDMFVTACEQLARTTLHPDMMEAACAHLDQLTCNRVVDHLLQRRRAMDVMAPIWKRCQLLPRALDHAMNAIVADDAPIFDALITKHPDLIHLHHAQIFLFALGRQKSWSILAIHTPERQKQWESLLSVSGTTPNRMEQDKCWHEVLAYLQRQTLAQEVEHHGHMGRRSKM